MSKKETYEDFVNKFKPKKSTDDCYTPPAVYGIILDYVKEKCNIEGLKVLRPFYPMGDYENENYTDDCVVIDNPPFSIISKIIRFYLDRNIKFFLFAPHLTLFGSDQDFTGVVVGADIVYENGAIVKTSFVTNILGDAKIIGCPTLYKRLKGLQELNKRNLPKYCYPGNVITLSRIASIVEKGVRVHINKNEVAFCRGLDEQKAFKKMIFGSGFLTTDKVAQELEAQELKAQELKAQELEAQELKIKKEVKIWEISERERKIIDELK